MSTISVVCITWAGFGNLLGQTPPQKEWFPLVMPPSPQQLQKEWSTGFLKVEEKRLAQLRSFRQQYEQLAREQPDNPVISEQIAKHLKEEEATRQLIEVLKQGKLPSVQEMKNSLK